MRGGRQHRVQIQKGQDGGETLPRMTDSRIGRLHRTTFCALKLTRSSHHPAIYWDSGLSFDACLEVHRREDLAHAVGGGRVLRGISSGSGGSGWRRYIDTEEAGWWEDSPRYDLSQYWAASSHKPSAR